MYTRPLVRFWAPLIALLAALTLWGTPPASAATVTVSGHVTGTPIGQVFFGHINFRTNNTAYSGSIATDGSWNASVPEGTYTVDVDGTPFPQNSGRFGDIRITRPGVQVSGSTMTLDLALPIVPITVGVSDGTAEPVTARAFVNCGATIDGTAYHFNAAVTDTSTVATWALPSDDATDYACNLTAVEGTGPSTDTSPIVVTAAGPNVFAVVVQHTNRISGRMTAGGIDQAESQVYDDEGQPSGYVGNPTLGTGAVDTHAYSFDLLPGIHHIAFNFYQYDADPEAGRQEHHWVRVDATENRTLDVDFPTRPLDVHFVDSAGQPTAVDYYSYGCRREVDFVFHNGGTPGPVNDHAYDFVYTSGVTSDGDVTIGIPPASDTTHPWLCSMQVALGDSNVTRTGAQPTGAEVTVVVPAGSVFEGTPEEPADTDGVSNLVEAQAPNGGDGNNDGTPDVQQANVTSLPSSGAGFSPGVPYVTVAGPTGTTLSDVSTLDPSTLANQPPPGTVLPAGLASFKLNVSPGATRTVSIYAGDATGVTGYAKYDPATQAWSVLPANLVQVYDPDDTIDDHVDITLTDGGVGDADGIVNGVISDPGGMARLPVQSDTTAPVVTGSATKRPNGAGWYSSAVTIKWTATDPGSGVASQPADTVVTTEGAAVTAQSAPVCDKAPVPNCARGSVTGLKIDRTPPSLAVSGVANGATYTLGAVPTAGCAASDSLSGLAAACKGLLVGGNANKVGSFAYGASVGDRAGNPRVTAAAYRVVYRFDGFAQPVNDPVATPGSSVSVFKAGSIVPLAFSVKKSNGQVVTPTSKPVWVAPTKGAKVTAAVNEAVVNGSGTSGSSYVWKNNRWQFDWSTKGLAAGYLYRVGVKLDDGTTHFVTVGLR